MEATIGDTGRRAETFVACHLLKAVEGWNDMGLGAFGLGYLRDKEKREVDFPYIVLQHMICMQYINGECSVMRALVDMNDAQIDALDTLAKRVRQSRAALIRAAIDDYLARHHREQVEDGFGLWGKGKVDGLAYQERTRREW